MDSDDGGAAAVERSRRQPWRLFDSSVVINELVSVQHVEVTGIFVNVLVRGHTPRRGARHTSTSIVQSESSEGVFTWRRKFE